MTLLFFKKVEGKTSVFLRGIAGAVLLTFVSQQISLAAPLPSGFSQPSAAAIVQKTDIRQIIQDPYRLDIPFEFAGLKEAHKGTNGKLIICIQDAHANLSGQKNLAATLDHLMSRYDIPLVLVEGADKEVTLDVIKDLASPEEWKIAAKRFLYDGVISGDEYLNLVSNYKIRLMGIEYGDLYDLNLKAYADLRLKIKMSRIISTTFRDRWTA